MRWTVPAASTASCGWIPPSGTRRAVTLGAAARAGREKRIEKVMIRMASILPRGGRCDSRTSFRCAGKVPKPRPPLKVAQHQEKNQNRDGREQDQEQAGGKA